MKLEIDIEYLPPIELGEYENVSVWLPDGREVVVWHDHITVTGKDRGRKPDGKTIWRAMSSRSRLWPYGKVRQPGGGEDLSEDEAPGAAGSA